MGEIIKITNLRKEYESVCAVENVSLSLTKGKIVGLLGPNGAGKTTIIKILNGLLRGYTGEVFINGMKPSAATKALISYLPDTTYFSNSELKVKFVVNMFKDLYDDFDIERCQQLLGKFNISLTSKIKSLSKGNKEKLQLALVLGRKAPIYILDEPIAGVDPAGREYILNLIMNNYCRDSLLLISTHLIQDIETIINEVIFIKEGKILLHKNKDVLEAERGMKINDIFKEDFKCYE